MDVFYEELIDGRYVAWLEFRHGTSRPEALIGPEQDCRNSAQVFEAAALVALDAGIDVVTITKRRRAA